MSDRSAADAQRRRDDLLEVLFWLSGEGIEGASTPATLGSLVAATSEQVEAELESLRRLRWVEREGGGYALTEEGRREAGRRFAESFADIAGRQGHGACDDDCDCHDSPEAADACHRSRHEHHAH